MQAQQSQPQDASCLPALKVSDIEPRIPATDLEVATAGQWRQRVLRPGWRSVAPQRPWGKGRTSGGPKPVSNPAVHIPWTAGGDSGPVCPFGGGGRGAPAVGGATAGGTGVTLSQGPPASFLSLASAGRGDTPCGPDTAAALSGSLEVALHRGPTSREGLRLCPGCPLPSGTCLRLPVVTGPNLLATPELVVCPWPRP